MKPTPARFSSGTSYACHKGSGLIRRQRCRDRLPFTDYHVRLHGHDGIVSSLSGILNDTRFLQISAAVQPGNSGWPLLASSGEVVGVVAAKLNALKFVKATGNIPENINFAIKTGALRDFLDNSAVSYQTADSKTELKRRISPVTRGLLPCWFLQG